MAPTLAHAARVHNHVKIATRCCPSIHTIGRRNLHTFKDAVQLSFVEHKPPSQQSDKDGKTVAPLVILHGLLGSKQNWNSLSKSFASRLNTTVYAVDARNHGESPWSEEFNYERMAEDVAKFVSDRGLSRVTLMGHSMGAKTAMQVAFTKEFQDLIDKLILVDMSPIPKNKGSLFSKYIEAMMRAESKGLTTNREIDNELKDVVKEPSVRAFLLTNFKPSAPASPLRARANLAILHKHLDELWTFKPSLQIPRPKFHTPSLFIAGSKSDYVTQDSLPLINEMFPKSKLEWIDAGHWLHSEKSQEFVSVVERWLLHGN